MVASKSPSKKVLNLILFKNSVFPLNIAFFHPANKIFVFLPVTSVLKSQPLAGTFDNQIQFFFLPTAVTQSTFYDSFAYYLKKFSKFFKPGKTLLFFYPLSFGQSIKDHQLIFRNISQTKILFPQKNPQRILKVHKSTRQDVKPKEVLLIFKKDSQRDLSIAFFVIPQQDFFFIPVTSLLTTKPISMNRDSFVQVWSFSYLLWSTSFANKVLAHFAMIIKVVNDKLQFLTASRRLIEFSTLFPQPFVSVKLSPEIVVQKINSISEIYPTKSIPIQFILNQSFLPELKSKKSLNISLWFNLNFDFYFLPVNSSLTKYPTGSTEKNRVIFLNLNYFNDYDFLYKYFVKHFVKIAKLKLYQIKIKKLDFSTLPLASSLKGVPKFVIQKSFFNLIKFQDAIPETPSVFLNVWTSLKKFINSKLFFWWYQKDKIKRFNYHNYDNPELYDSLIKNNNEYNWNLRQYKTLRYRQKKKSNKINEQLLVTSLDPSPEKYIIELENISKYYLVERVVTKVFHNVNLKIKKGEFVVILGPSGSGKTTLLNVMSGIDLADTGDVLVSGQNLTMMDNSALTNFRRHYVGIIFQSYNLLQNLTARENIEIGAYLASTDKKTIPIDELMDILEISDLADSYSYQLSGGQQQRFSIARAIAKNPDLLFCDEPTGALDQKMSRKVLKTLLMIQRRYKTTIILITHNEKFSQIADTVIRFKDGKVMKIDRNENKLSINKLEI